MENDPIIEKTVGLMEWDKKIAILVVLISIFISFATGWISKSWLVDSQQSADQIIEITSEQATQSTLLSDTNRPMIEEIRKEIDGIIYFFERNEKTNSSDSYQNKLNFVAFHGDKPVNIAYHPDAFSYGVASLVSESTLDFWFQFDGLDHGGVLFTVEGILPQLNTSFETIGRFELQYNGHVDSEELLYAHKPGLYTKSEIIDYFKDIDTLLLKTEGGDGCGGGGVLWTLNTEGHRKDIEKFVTGCSVDKDTSLYKGYFDRNLYFSTVKHDESNPSPNNYAEDQYFLVNPISMRREFIQTLPKEI